MSDLTSAGNLCTAHRKGEKELKSKTQKPCELSSSVIIKKKKKNN